MAVYAQPPDLATRIAELYAALAMDQATPRRIDDEHGPLLVSDGTAPLLLTAPHEVPHWRNGAEKFGEGGTAALARTLAAATGAAALTTHETQTGDPNDDEVHRFRDLAVELGAGRVGLDLHMMQPRGFEVCLGLGPDVALARPVFDVVCTELLAADVRFAVNWPFGARGRTVTALLQHNGVPAVQVEVAYDCFESDHTSHAAVFSALLRSACRLANATL